MSKKTATQPLSDNTRKLIIIIAIVLVAVIILSIALALILKPDVKIPADENADNSNASTLPIKNGDFYYTSSDDTAYPRTAVNWTRYGYKQPSGTTHDFQSITNNDKSVMGIVDLDKWDEVTTDLEDESITGLTNPGVHDGIEAEDKNIYMIYNKTATAASILSDSASVSSGASIKITVWLNTQYVKSGNAVIMIQKSTVSAKDENWYAYNFEIAAQDGWQAYEFYIFNRESSTKYIRVSIGLGDVYQEGANAEEGKAAEGVLFVDDISYETKTANDYREQVDNYEGNKETEIITKPFQIIENEDIEDDSEYFGLDKALDTSAITTYESYDAFKDGEGEDKAYLPFTKRDDFTRDGKATDFTIFKVTQEGTGVTALRLNANGEHNGIKLESSPIEKDHYHISFWVRVQQNDGHQATEANVYVQKYVGGTVVWEGLDKNSQNKKVVESFVISTNQDIETDTNCGWAKYDIYLKPSTAQAETISILFVLGNKDGYENDDDGMVPRGSLYVTSPAYEKISYKDYNNASGGGNVKKYNLIGDSSNTTITNGSFSDVNSIGTEPTSWTPVFAGDNAIYKDGKGNKLSDEKREASLVAGSGVSKTASAVDDAQNSTLQITTSNTNFGYISNEISLSSRTIYVFSVMAKVGSGKPFIYLIDNSKEDREKAIVARNEKAYANSDDQKTLDDKYFNYFDPDDVPQTNLDGWARYYLVYVTGNQSSTIRIALFNGAIDATGENATFSNGTIFYDDVQMKSIGNYTFVDDEETEEPTHYLVKFNATDGYKDTIKDLFGEDNTTGAMNAESAILGIIGKDAFNEPDEDAWLEMRLIPEETESNDGGDEEPETKTPTNIDWGLLMSVISSIILVAALLIVFVIKLFQRKRPRAA